MDDPKHQLEYAPPRKPNQSRSVIVWLVIIGSVFGISYLAFVFWWSLFR